MSNFIRPIFKSVMGRLKEPRKFIQVLAGPRQTGKTTLAHHAIENFKGRGIYVSADSATLAGSIWLEQQWNAARLAAAEKKGEVLLVLDEVQKVPKWSDTVKQLWDEDTHAKHPIKVLLLGSSPMLMQKGLTESLAGRFETIHITHWSFAEMRKAFGFNLEQYLYFGGYPGGAALFEDADRWRNYITDSLIETTIARDILLMNRVDKPALLRRLFELSCHYSGQVLSFNKMLGQLQDAGNTTTLSHYLELLAGAAMVGGLQKYANDQSRQRGSSPKLMVYNTALHTALDGRSLAEWRKQPEDWGRLVESTVGAHLLNAIRGTNIELFYWRHVNEEVDFVLRRARKKVAFEVKSGRRRETLSGMEAFAKAFKPEACYLIGHGGIELETFLTTPIQRWFGDE